jgi:hypothetical protein
LSNGILRTRKEVRVRIIATTGVWAQYKGQQCDAVLYDEPGVLPQINSEQLDPPIPAMQSIDPAKVEVVKTKCE